jgi:hypothetical protein
MKREKSNGGKDKEKQFNFLLVKMDHLASKRRSAGIQLTGLKREPSHMEIKRLDVDEATIRESNGRSLNYSLKMSRPRGKNRSSTFRANTTTNKSRERITVPGFVDVPGSIYELLNQKRRMAAYLDEVDCYISRDDSAHT